MGYTPEQEKCVERLVGPVDVSAGAGSGKTFTLTQRIAYALQNHESGVTDIDQVVAITFTKAAAAELKSRVRSTLRAQGMFEQASKVDSAWISTIHGMCSRILRANALEIGIDPGFSVMEDSSEILDQAMEEVLEELRGKEYGGYEQLFEAYHMVAKGDNDVTIPKMLDVLLNEAHALPRGFNDIHLVVSQDEPSALVRQLIGIYEEALALMDELKESAAQAKNKHICEQALDVLHALVQRENALDMPQLREALDSCLCVGANCGSGAQKETIKELQAAYYQVVMRVLFAESSRIFKQLVQLARKVDKRFAQKKRSLAVFDNADLVHKTYEALQNPQIHAQYKDKFRLVMIDEFQDTDALQLSIVRKLSGEGQRYLCTVGDAQQSIYRFRGADVSLYRSYQQHLFDPSVKEAGGDPCSLRLTRNFRSHGDILAFVKRVCSQQSVFGKDFLDLQAVYDGAKYRAQGQFPRVFVDITQRHKGTSAEVGAQKDAVAAQAQRVAEYFERMHTAGHALSEMVLLLGSTFFADLYAQAIRQAGFDCVISGGSLFSKSDEAKHMMLLCRALVNFKDTQALTNVLMGPLFQLSAAELLELSSVWDEEAQMQVKCSVDAGLARCYKAARVGAPAAALGESAGEGVGAGATQEGATQEGAPVFSPACIHAAKLLYAARAQLKTRPLSSVLLRLLWQSGAFVRLQAQGAQGTASMGNYMKALRLIEKIQDEGVAGPASVTQKYCSTIEAGMKEAPGALNVHEQQAIRIMTIHASKGLEFPIVALADFQGKPHANNLFIARFQGTTYSTLFFKSVKIGTKPFGVKNQRELVGEEEELSVQALGRGDAFKNQVLLERHAAQEELEEAQRKFYVGATRAKEALGIFMTAQENDDPAAMFPYTYGDVVRALFPDSGLAPVGESRVDYGGSEPALVRCQWLEMPVEGEGEVAGEGGAGEAAATSEVASRLFFELPSHEPLNVVYYQPCCNQGLFSYSSLTGEQVSYAELEGLWDASESQEDMRASALRAAASDEDKATSFGLALHRACQLGFVTSEQVAHDQLECIAKAYEVNDVARLRAAHERWVASAANKRAKAMSVQLPEYPFTLQFAETDQALEGVFDLLCFDEAHENAYVVDYKTGGKAQETPLQLHEKHGLQAMCYAYALLSQGVLQVDMDFVRVEQNDPAGADSLQTVAFHFDQGDKQHLQEVIALRCS